MTRLIYGFKLRKIKKALRGLNKKSKILLMVNDGSPCSISMKISKSGIDMQFEEFSGCTEYGMRIIFDGHDFSVKRWNSYEDLGGRNAESNCIQSAILDIFKNHRFKNGGWLQSTRCSDCGEYSFGYIGEFLSECSQCGYRVEG